MARLQEMTPRFTAGQAAWRDTECGTVYVFNGGHTVNVWEERPSGWENVDVFSFGSFARDTMTPEEAEEAVKSYLLDFETDADPDRASESGRIDITTVGILLMLAGFAYLAAHIVAFAMRAMDTVGGAL